MDRENDKSTQICHNYFKLYFGIQVKYKVTQRTTANVRLINYDALYHARIQHPHDDPIHGSHQYPTQKKR